MPETEAELERHREFVRRRGGVEAQVPDAKLVLWSKVLAVVEQPNCLDSFHHGTSAELWALTQQFAIVWSGVTRTTGHELRLVSQTQNAGRQWLGSRPCCSCCAERSATWGTMICSGPMPCLRSRLRGHLG